MNEPILSICVLTYNHEEYIAQALDSILSQKTKYNYEIIVLEDCSTDNTQEILKKYKELYPDVIDLYFQPKNTKAKHFHEGFKHCKAKYICILEGDDYWTQDNKLETQLDFLEANPEFIGCTHNTITIYENQDIPPALVVPKKKYDVFSINELTLNSIYCHTSSYIFRNVFNGCLPSIHTDNEECGDWFLSMLYAEYGPIKYIDEVMSAYRQTGKGAWTSFTPIEQAIKNIRCVIKYNKLFDHKYEFNFLTLAIALLDNIFNRIKSYSSAPEQIESTAKQLEKSIRLQTEWTVVEKKLDLINSIVERVLQREKTNID